MIPREKRRSERFNSLSIIFKIYYLTTFLLGLKKATGELLVLGMRWRSWGVKKEEYKGNWKFWEERERRGNVRSTKFYMKFKFKR